MKVFVSDVHLTKPHDESYEAFLRFLDMLLTSVEPVELFLVGDIFDLWVGDKNIFIKRHRLFLEKIKELTSKGSVHYLEGNHDFLFGKFWSGIGVKTYDKHYIFEEDGKKIFVTHGDLINKSDKSYQRLRSFFRSSFTKNLIKILPGKIIDMIGQSLSQTHKKESYYVDRDFKKNLPTWINQIKKDFNVDLVVFGHYHQRTITQIDGVDVINLGTWLDGTYQYFDLEKMHFKFSL